MCEQKAAMIDFEETNEQKENVPEEMKRCSGFQMQSSRKLEDLDQMQGGSLPVIWRN